MSLPEASIEWVARHFGVSPKELSIVALTPDMGDRTYYRVRIPAGRSIVLCQHPGPISLRLPFFVVQSFLAQNGFDVPSIHACDESLGVILEDDLGDMAISKTDPKVHTESILQILIKLSHLNEALLPPDSSIRTHALDRALFQRELNHTNEWFVKKFGELSQGECSLFTQHMERILAHVDEYPRVICHRDFHVNNIFYFQNRYFMIDFQDMRLGFGGYDVFSLLFEREGAFDHDRDFLQPRLNLVTRYWKESRYAKSLSQDAFMKAFAVNGLQRCLKALGNFTRNQTVYKNYIPLSIRSLREMLTLTHHVAPELQRDVSGLERLLASTIKKGASL